MTTHVLRRTSDQFDYRLVDPRFHVGCSCGWQAPGWFADDGPAFEAWAEHVHEANEEA